ncbi:MAG: hypothetical protein MMC33_006840 [Icmadophila ericetorum]|nr:hypothetical protein [Icmadophila ericetorum]
MDINSFLPGATPKKPNPPSLQSTFYETRETITVPLSHVYHTLDRTCYLPSLYSSSQPSAIPRSVTIPRSTTIGELARRFAEAVGDDERRVCLCSGSEGGLGGEGGGEGEGKWDEGRVTNEGWIGSAPENAGISLEPKSGTATYTPCGGECESGSRRGSGSGSGSVGTAGGFGLGKLETESKSSEEEEEEEDKTPIQARKGSRMDNIWSNQANYQPLELPEGSPGTGKKDRLLSRTSSTSSMEAVPSSSDTAETAFSVGKRSSKEKEKKSKNLLNYRFRPDIKIERPRHFDYCLQQDQSQRLNYCFPNQTARAENIPNPLKYNSSITASTANQLRQTGKESQPVSSVDLNIWERDMSWYRIEDAAPKISPEEKRLKEIDADKRTAGTRRLWAQGNPCHPVQGVPCADENTRFTPKAAHFVPIAPAPKASQEQKMEGFRHLAAHFAAERVAGGQHVPVKIETTNHVAKVYNRRASKIPTFREDSKLYEQTANELRLENPAASEHPRRKAEVTLATFEDLDLARERWNKLATDPMGYQSKGPVDVEPLKKGKELKVGDLCSQISDDSQSQATSIPSTPRDKTNKPQLSAWTKPVRVNHNTDLENWKWKPVSAEVREGVKQLATGMMDIPPIYRANRTQTMKFSDFGLGLLPRRVKDQDVQTSTGQRAKHVFVEGATEHEVRLQRAETGIKKEGRSTAEVGVQVALEPDHEQLPDTHREGMRNLKSKLQLEIPTASTTDMPEPDFAMPHGHIHSADDSSKEENRENFKAQPEDKPEERYRKASLSLLESPKVDNSKRLPSVRRYPSKTRLLSPLQRAPEPDIEASLKRIPKPPYREIARKLEQPLPSLHIPSPKPVSSKIKDVVLDSVPCTEPKLLEHPIFRHGIAELSVRNSMGPEEWAETTRRREALKIEKIEKAQDERSKCGEKVDSRPLIFSDNPSVPPPKGAPLKLIPRVPEHNNVRRSRIRELVRQGMAWENERHVRMEKESAEQMEQRVEQIKLLWKKLDHEKREYEESMKEMKIESISYHTTVKVSVAAEEEEKGETQNLNGTGVQDWSVCERTRMEVARAKKVEAEREEETKKEMRE